MQYAFVDGKYLRTHYSEAMRRFFDEVPAIDYLALRTFLASAKLFFYDSLDESKREGETDETARERIATAETELGQIEATAGCHVRRGSVTGKGVRKRRQKQVDVLLAVEMLTHGFRQNFEKASLLAGDLDFKPVVDSLVAFGAFVEVCYVSGHASPKLLMAADERRALTLVEFYAWSGASFRERHRLPVVRETDSRPGQHYLCTRSGTFQGKRVFVTNDVLRHPVGLWVQQFQKGQDLWIGYHDVEKLDVYFSMLYGDIEWTS